MGTVRFCAANLLRRRVGGMLAIAALIGLAGAITLAAFAGARRTDSAFPRLLEDTRALDVQVSPDFGETISRRDLEQIPSVEEAFTAYGFVILRSKDGDGAFSDSSVPVGAIASPQDVSTGVERSRLTAGRLPRKDRADEIYLNEAAARSLGLNVGSKAKFSLYEYADLILPDGSVNPDAEVTPLTLTVVGIGRDTDDLLLNENQDTETSVLSSAFLREYRDRASYVIAGVFLERGLRDFPAFTEDLNRAMGDAKFQLLTSAARADAFAAVAEPYSASLLLFGLAAAVSALIVVAQALVRIVSVDSLDAPALAALGAPRRTRAVIASGRALVAIFIGAVVAVTGAIALSPLFPLGRASEAEPSPGLDADVAVLGAGFIAIVVVLAAPTVASAWRMARRRTADETAAADRPVRSAERLAAGGAPPSLVTGVRFAFRAADGRRISIITTLFGLVVAAATVIAALTFGTSLDRMIETPARYGWTWDAVIDTRDAGVAPELAEAVRDDEQLAALTIGTRGAVTLDGTTLSGYGLQPVRGRALPRAREGRMPTRATEIAVGAKALRALGKKVGATVNATSGDGGTVRLRIVGQTALPSLALNNTDGLGDGVALTRSGLRRLDPTAEPSFFLVDLAANARLEQIRDQYGEVADTLGPQRPNAILTYDEVRRTPLLLAALLGLLGACVLVHLLVTSVRARRRDLAVLKTIGFTRRQIALTVAAQATTLVVVALLIALPLGIVIGRWTWSTFATDIGVVAGVVWPVLPVVAVALLTLLVGNAAAAFPARTAARTRAALVLRSE